MESISSKKKDIQERQIPPTVEGIFSISHMGQNKQSKNFTLHISTSTSRWKASKIDFEIGSARFNAVSSLMDANNSLSSFSYNFKSKQASEPGFNFPRSASLSNSLISSWRVYSESLRLKSSAISGELGRYLWRLRLHFFSRLTFNKLCHFFQSLS